jgi:hypothetical protein
MLRNILLSDYSEITSSSLEERTVLEMAFKKIQASIDNGEIKINGGSKYINPLPISYLIILTENFIPKALLGS